MTAVQCLCKLLLFFTKLLLYTHYVYSHSSTRSRQPLRQYDTAAQPPTASRLSAQLSASPPDTTSVGAESQLQPTTTSSRDKPSQRYTAFAHRAHQQLQLAPVHGKPHSVPTSTPMQLNTDWDRE